MRNIFIAFVISLLTVHSAQAEPAVSINGFMKADFKHEMHAPKLSKLLGAGQGYLFVAKQDGLVEAINAEGQVALTFPKKEGDTVLLKQPVAAVVGGDTLYVLDNKTEQVVMYALSDARFLGRFGASAGGFFGGGDDNALSSPRGLALLDGVIYVADTGKSRIQLFGVNGVFLHTLELGGPRDADNSKEVSYKPKEPVAIGLDTQGRLYVLDAEDNQTKIYATNGAFIKSLSNVKKPVDIGVADDGIYVVDGESQVISKYDLDGKLSYTFGSKGEGKSQFIKISGIAVEKGQQVYIGDAEKGVVNVFLTQAGNKLDLIPREAGRVSMKWLGSLGLEVAGLAGNGKGDVYAISKDTRSLIKLRGGKVVAEIKPEDMEISAVAIDGSGALWVTDKKKKRCLKLDESGNTLLGFGSSGSGAGQFSSPSSIAIASSGLVFIADRGNGSVQVFRQDGVYLSTLGAGSAKLSNPLAISFDPKDNLYVLDGERGSVSVFSPKGDYVFEFGKLKEGSLFNKPIGMVATADEVFVLDGNQVKSFNLKGEPLRVFGTKKTGAGSLSEPVALAKSDASTVHVAESSGKLVHSYAVLYKPKQIKQFTAEGRVHAIELSWEKPVTEYSRAFRVYRSKTETGGFVQIATVTGNTYLDAGMDADARYFYRIAAISDYGFEGATSNAVSATAQKYFPQPVGAIKAEATPWQVKMNWEAADQQYFAAYRIYQKEGDAFVKIGEVTQPEFTKDALIPETKYTYYVSVLSSDQTESDKVPVEATTLVFNRPPLEIEIVQLADVFSNSYKLYERDGVGRIKLTNNTDKPIEKLRVSFLLKNFMDFSTESKVAKLLPGESEELILKAVFNNSILTVTEDSPVQALIEASYFESGKRVVYGRNETVNIYDKHRLTWDERERFAAFVTPKDPPILNLVRSVVSEFKDTKDEVQLAAALFDALGVFGLTYIQDPSNPYQISSGKAHTVDYIQFPRETLERKSGDCDDMVAVYSSGLESMGIMTRVIEVPGHMLMMFSTGIPADEDRYTMNNLYVIYEDTLWIPVETTLMGNSFIKAWEKGSATYYKFKDKGLTILDVRSAWEKFKPASLPDTEWNAGGITRAAIEKKFPGDHTSVMKISSQTKTRRYLEAIKQNPSDVDAHLQMGIILAKLGDRSEAMKYFDKVVAMDAKNAAAMNNRGNLLMIEDKYVEAQNAYLAASKLTPNDAQILVNLARAYKRTGNTKNAKAAFAKAQKLEPEVKDQNRALALELNSAL